MSARRPSDEARQQRQPPHAVEAAGLLRTFGDRASVDHVSFSVRNGESLGVLGPNGAGKTTLMRMISAILPRSGGELSVDGLDPTTHGPEIRARLGIVPQDDNLDLELSTRENVYIYGRFFGLRRKYLKKKVAEVLEFVDLSDRANLRVRELSGGMKRRLTIARALVNSPDILLLDEPSTGLDPHARHAVWSRLRALQRTGVTLIMTTHFMDEAEQLCDRVMVMESGRIIAEGGPQELIKEHAGSEIIELRLAEPDVPPAVEMAEAEGYPCDVVGDRFITFGDTGRDFSRGLTELGITPLSTLVRRATLEDVYLRMTGRTLSNE